MGKPIRKGVRTYLINENKIVVIRYLTPKNMDYYDIPGGKIENNETNVNAAIREFKEETGIDIFDLKLVGNLIVEYPEMIFDIDIFITKKYNGTPCTFAENESMWIDIDSLLKEEKRFKTTTLLSKTYNKYLTTGKNFKIKFVLDDNDNIINKNIEVEY